MAFASGDLITAARLNRLQPVTYRASQSGGVITLTATEADLTGASVTLTTQAANALYVVQGIFDFECTTAGTGIALGRLNVDGTTDTTTEAHHSGAGVSRDTDSQTWRGTLASAGSHTLKLRALKNIAGTSVLTTNPVHTAVLVTIYEVA